MGNTVPFSLLTMNDDIMKECTFAPRHRSFEVAESVIKNEILEKLNEQIIWLEASKKLGEYNIAFSVEVAIMVNQLKFISHD